jgi:hypothetical protein
MTFVRSCVRAFVIAASFPVALTACRVSMSPIQNRLAPGEEPFAVFVANGEAGVGDLFAVRAEGGATFPVTYTRVRELAPALSPSGTALAFLREATPGRPETRTVVVMNLLNGGERALPRPASPAEAVAWSADGSELFVRTETGIVASATPPSDPALRALDDTGAARADSAFAVLLGSPAFGRAVDCPEGGICVLLPDGRRSVVAADGRGAVRWGADSVGYFSGAGFVVRPLGPGRQRELRLTPPPLEPREMTFFPGPPAPR